MLSSHLHNHRNNLEGQQVLSGTMGSNWRPNWASAGHQRHAKPPYHHHGGGHMLTPIMDTVKRHSGCLSQMWP